jgi:hypothetical protein
MRRGGALLVLLLSVHGVAAEMETLWSPTMPTAGIPPRGALVVRMGMFPEGTLAVQLTGAPVERLMLGLGFGASNLIGAGAVQWQRIPGVELRWRLLEETLQRPAVVLGVHTQGWGAYDAEERRFEIPSAGVFLAAAKSFRWWLGGIAWHAVVGYSLEPPVAQRRLSAAVAVEHTVGSLGAVMLEYNSLGSDAAHHPRYRSGGILSGALRWNVAARATVELQVVDLLGRQREGQGYARAVAVTWRW